MNFIVNALIAISTTLATSLPNSINTNVINTEKYDFIEHWFEQPLNHFDISDSRTFLLRYYEDDSYFKTGGPILLEIGGESTLDSSFLKQAQSYELAKELHGKFFALEHRYYGKSTPFKILKAENLIYLSVEQALEDLSNFIYTIKKITPTLTNSKVAVFGCSYSGSLATWLRYKYPHIVDAAYASSAPLRAVSDFYEYLEVASEVYSNVSWGCYNKIQKGYNEAKKLLSTPTGREQVEKALENWSCGNPTEMNNSLILSNMRFVIADHNIPPDHGASSCHIFNNVNSSAFQALVLFLKVKSSEVCSEDDENDIYSNNEVAWSYQTCTEFGFSITMNSLKQPFNDSYSVIDDDLKSCSSDFGIEFNKDLLQKGIERINQRYAAQNIRVTKLLTVHGAQDPWHKLGLQKESTIEAPVIIIPGASHCADQLSQDNEPLQLTVAKQTARLIITEWLK